MIEIIADTLNKKIHIEERIWHLVANEHKTFTTKNVFEGDQALLIAELLSRIESLENNDD